MKVIRTWALLRFSPLSLGLQPTKTEHQCPLKKESPSTNVNLKLKLLIQLMYNIHCISWSILALLVEQSDYIQIMGFNTSSNQSI